MSNGRAFRGKIKAIDQKASRITIQNSEGDLVGIKVDDDVSMVVGKETKHLRDVAIDEKVTLLYLPKAPAPKDPDEPVESGIYKQAR